MQVPIRYCNDATIANTLGNRIETRLQASRLTIWTLTRGELVRHLQRFCRSPRAVNPENGLPSYPARNRFAPFVGAPYWTAFSLRILPRPARDRVLSVVLISNDGERRAGHSNATAGPALPPQRRLAAPDERHLGGHNGDKLNV